MHNEGRALRVMVIALVLVIAASMVAVISSAHVIGWLAAIGLATAAAVIALRIHKQ